MRRRDKYEKSRAERSCMRFQTRHPDGDAYQGVITHIQKGFVVLREQVDFEWDGVVVLPKRFIKGVRDSKSDHCTNEILRQNGMMERLHPAEWLDACETIPQLIAALMRHDTWPIVEAFREGDDDPLFYIGRIMEVTEDDFVLKHYTAYGQWDKDYRLAYRNTLRIEFDSTYCNHFNTYMRSKPDSYSASESAER